MNLPSRIYDLSQPVFNNCPQYPDTNPRPAQVRWMYIHGVELVNKEIVEISTHTGTHCDAPFHFFSDGVPIDRVPLADYIGPAVIIDVRHKAPGSSIDLDDISAHLERIAPGDVVLLNTGFGHKRANTKEFLTEYVWCSGPAAQAIVERGAKGVGIDAVSFGGYNDAQKAGPGHRAVLGAGKFIVEELYFPDEVMDGKERLFVTAPVKLRDCSGAWTRAALWEFS
ncbi:MAG: cyclase family protein [Candidatus Eremiobacteraeota bacterium]|nr:cyclase family protein [Candidatus Eremiobacteraeota bacterium]